MTRDQSRSGGAGGSGEPPDAAGEASHWQAGTSSADGIRGAAVAGLLWTFLTSTSSRLVGTVVFVLLARLLDPASFGTAALASVFVVLVSLIVESGFGEALVQRKDLTPTVVNTAFWANCVIGVALAGLMAAGAGLVSAPFHQPDLAPVLRVLSIAFILAALCSVPQAMLRRNLAFRTLAVRGVVATLAGGAVSVGMALGGFGVWSLVGQMLANQAVGALALWVGCPWRPGRDVSRSGFAELLRFGLNILGERISLFVSRRADDFLIGLVLGAVALGLYTVAYNILLLVTEILISTVGGVAFPLFSRLHGNVERTRRAFYAITRICTAVATPVFIGLFALAPELIRLAFGPTWLASAPVTQVLALVGLPHALTYVNKALVNGAGRPDLSLRVALLTGAVNVLGFFVVVRHGILAVAASYVICGYLLVPVSVWSVTRVLKIEVKTYLRLFVPPLASGAIMLLSVLAAKVILRGHSEIVRLGALCVVAAVAYLAMLLLTDRSLVRTVLTRARRVATAS